MTTNSDFTTYEADFNKEQFIAMLAYFSKINESADITLHENHGTRYSTLDRFLDEQLFALELELPEDWSTHYKITLEKA